ncbi:MAG TPA: ribulose-phosphate 3-epimerase [Firmicutes bacterium]|nr:ribulose-phosphate 3-epimerase [Bacillota bacterium]
MIKIAPSILSSDFSILAEEVASVKNADLLHVDIMDGHFVPNITIGPPVVRCLRPRTGLPMDVHLMIERPENYIRQFADAGADILTIHVEATTHLNRALNMVAESGVKVGVALNPATPLCFIEDVLDLVDMILIMTVNPGFGGQEFIKSSLDRIARARAMVERSGRNIDIEVDGGIANDTAPLVVKAGANVLVAGQAIFGADSPSKAVEDLRRALGPLGQEAVGVPRVRA